MLGYKSSNETLMHHKSNLFFVHLLQLGTLFFLSAIKEHKWSKQGGGIEIKRALPLLLEDLLTNKEDKGVSGRDKCRAASSQAEVRNMGEVKRGGGPMKRGRRDWTR